MSVDNQMISCLLVYFLDIIMHFDLKILLFPSLKKSFRVKLSMADG